MIKELERAADRGGAAPGGPGAPPTATTGARPRPSSFTTRGRTLPEGTFLVSRRGRMLKSTDGEWTYVFDSAPGGRAEPPMTLMPCLNLAAMERTAEGRGDSATFSVSGQVFVYKDKNYLLPTMYVVNRKADEVLPTQ